METWKTKAQLIHFRDEYLQKVKKRGRPAQYVKDGQGIAIEGLSLKSDGRYYTTHNCPITGKRMYFGRKLNFAVSRFKDWKRKLKIPS